MEIGLMGEARRKLQLLKAKEGKTMVDEQGIGVKEQGVLPEERCELCRHWHKRKDSPGEANPNQGDCWRNPPQVFVFPGKAPLTNQPILNIQCFYPVTLANNACGEFKVRVN
jgi:hypothetical protein